MVVTDVRMPPGFSDEGLQAAIALRADDPELPVLVLSQYVEQTYASELLDSGRSTAVAEGRTVVDPELIRQLLARARRRDPLQLLTPREREVLALMAEGRSNTAIARALVVTEAAVAKHIGSVLTKLELPPADDHRRVRAVLAYLRS
jgi:DNA-binding NarL/FixJ family response regulator